MFLGRCHCRVLRSSLTGLSCFASQEFMLHIVLLKKTLFPWVINNMEQCMHCLSFGIVSITRLYLKKKKKEPLLVSPKQSLDPFQL